MPDTLAASIVHPFNNNWNVLIIAMIYSFACFNRTSFQQQLKRVFDCLVQVSSKASIVHPFNNNWNAFKYWSVRERATASIVHPFNNNWNALGQAYLVPYGKLQSYILSTTTETSIEGMTLGDIEELQSYILSTTTETTQCFFRIYFRLSLQSYILSTTTETISP